MSKFKPMRRCTVGVPSYNRFYRSENNRRLNGGGGVSISDWEQRAMNNKADIFKVRLSER